MRAVVQRVKEARVTINGNLKGSINKGLLVFIGVEKGDTEGDIDYIVSKLIGLRVFDDLKGNMNLSIKDVSGSLLIISQFTLLGDVRKGRRPSFDKAETPDKAEAIYNAFLKYLEKKMGIKPETGIFRAHMEICLINDGPVTILLDSRKRF